MKALYPKAILWMVVCIWNLCPVIACGPYYDDPDGDYYNLFLQEIIEDEVYKPFLLTATSSFYHTDKSQVRNENIEEWQEYLDISYDEARYLVFEAGEGDIQALLKGGKANDPELGFITAAFLKKYRQALEYIAYAKELEPYMYITDSPDSWYHSSAPTAGDLDYEEVTSRLKTGWKKARDKELRLRYGYQLVRFAHYNRNYEEAIELFDKYVESLNFRPAMYYHALSQKAGAERGNGEVSLANYHFLQVFTNSKNLKETAVLSIRINDNPDWQALVDQARNNKELNDAYLLLGYSSFNNPVREIAKIVENDSDAVQARVLMVRAINQIERSDMPLYHSIYSYEYARERKEENADKRYPQAGSVSDEILTLSEEMTRNPAVQDRNFWLMTSAYLHFLHKDFTLARAFLEQVEEENEKYALQKMNFSFYIDISEPPVITPQLEVTLYERYTELLERSKAIQGEGYYYSDTQAFVRDVWANRYYLQQDYAKSFLLTHPVSYLERNPDPQLLDRLEEFYLKPDKNPMEKYIADNFYQTDSQVYSGRKNYLDYLRGIICLTQGDLSGAQQAFQKTDPADIKVKVPDYVFAANITEWFNVDPDTVMIRDYLSDFPFIPAKMNYEELTTVLLKLEKTGKRKSSLAAKANYLLGNFFYNTSGHGYYRHLLRFDTDNYYCYKFDDRKKPDIYNDIYFKYYPVYYENPYPQSEKYLRLAYKQARDRELKAHLLFALAKCEQGAYYEKHPSGYYGSRADIFISDHFEELMQYVNTSYFEEVVSACKYFEYYARRSVNPALPHRAGNRSPLRGGYAYNF